MPLTKEEMKEFADEMNRTFGPPFLPEGHVIVEVLENDVEEDADPEDAEEFYLSFNIGRRDAQFDADLQLVGSGTDLGIGDD